jgi:hypothetical protein
MLNRKRKHENIIKDLLQMEIKKRESGEPKGHCTSFCYFLYEKGCERENDCS